MGVLTTLLYKTYLFNNLWRCAYTAYNVQAFLQYRYLVKSRIRFSNDYVQSHIFHLAIVETGSFAT